MGARWLAALVCASLSLTSPSIVLAQQPDITTPQPANDGAEDDDLGEEEDPTLDDEPALDEEELAEVASLLAQWLLAASLLTGALAIAFGVAQYARKENWYRIEFLRKSVKEFEQDPEIWKALKILDFEDYRDYEFVNRGKTISFRVNNDILCAALGTHDERARRKKEIDELKAKGTLDEATLEHYQIETVLRDWFNKMLNGLEHFGYFVESGLFSPQEIRPWMIYWIRLIADRNYKRPGASKFYDQLYSYIHEYGFSGVIKLFEKFGYRILPTPYREQDFVSLPSEIKEFSLPMALSLAKSAYLIYQDMSYVAEISQRWTIDVKNDFRYFNNRDRDTQAVLFRTKTFMVLAFRGSQEIKDWQTNFRTRLKKFTITTGMEPLKEDWTPPRGQVHRGFQAGWNSIEDSVIRQIRKWNQSLEKPLPLFIAGHSLGGALATVAAASLVKRKFDVQGLYTFGQPRVGDLIFTAEIGQLLQGKVFRFVNNNDLVPHIPPPYLPWNPLRIYRHMGQLYYFDAFGNMTTHSSAVLRFLNFWIGLARDVFEPGFDMINDHRMEYYITNLEKALSVQIERERLMKEEQEGA